MSRVRINPYGISKSAKLLTEYLGCKRLLSNGSSRFVGRSSDVVINWGIGKGNVGNARQINKLENVQLASNKLHTLMKLQEHGVMVPDYGTSCVFADYSSIVVARTKLHGHSGDGIVIGTPSELPRAPLYVEYIPKVAEYRAIVVGGKVVDFKMKKKKSSPRDEATNEVIEEERIEHDEHVWNVGGGYIFARNGFTVPTDAGQLGIDSVVALGLDFGAVDIIEAEDGTLYVLEVNTAFGIEGTTLELVGDAILELISPS